MSYFDATIPENPPQDAASVASSQLEIESEQRLDAILALKQLVHKQRQKIDALKKKQRERKAQIINDMQQQEPTTVSGTADEEETFEENAVSTSIDKGGSNDEEEEEERTGIIMKQISKREEDGCELHDDVYSMLFLADFPSRTFWFAFCVFLLKCTLYTFIAVDLFQGENSVFDEKTNLVRAAQFFMLPVAVAIQEDLISSYNVIANMKYDARILDTCPGATKQKANFSVVCRLIDGMYSLTVNTILLLQSTDVLSLFLNFAALQFLQSIDNVAFTLAADGFLTDDMEMVVSYVKTISLPAKSNKLTTRLDTILFVATYFGLLAAWIALTV